MRFRFCFGFDVSEERKGERGPWNGLGWSEKGGGGEPSRTRVWVLARCLR